MTNKQESIHTLIIGIFATIIGGYILFLIGDFNTIDEYRVGFLTWLGDHYSTPNWGALVTILTLSYCFRVVRQFRKASDSLEHKKTGSNEEVRTHQPSDGSSAIDQSNTTNKALSEHELLKLRMDLDSDEKFVLRGYLALDTTSASTERLKTKIRISNVNLEVALEKLIARGLVRNRQHSFSLESTGKQLAKYIKEHPTI